MFIGISGLIGVGKSTLTRRLAEHLRYKAYYEPVTENPYLEDFYRDMTRWTFNMQTFLLFARFEQHQELVWDPCHKGGGGVVQDRTIYEDTIFARMHYNDGLMDERDYATYTGHFNIMRRYLVYPDVIIYLRVTPEQAMERIQQRGRDAEKAISMEYLQALFDGYEQYAEEMRRYTLVLPLDWSEYIPVGVVAGQIKNLTDRNRDFLKSLRRV